MLDASACAQGFAAFVAPPAAMFFNPDSNGRTLIAGRKTVADRVRHAVAEIFAVFGRKNLLAPRNVLRRNLKFEEVAVFDGAEIANAKNLACIRLPGEAVPVAGPDVGCFFALI